jgi:hypothetical protein
VLNGTADVTFQVGAGTATTDSIKVAASSGVSGVSGSVS